jgi:hypothetical protein
MSTKKTFIHSTKCSVLRYNISGAVETVHKIYNEGDFDDVGDMRINTHTIGALYCATAYVTACKSINDNTSDSILGDFSRDY